MSKFKNSLIAGFILALSTYTTVRAQGFHIKGDVKNIPNNMVYLTMVGKDLVNTDSIMSNDGQFNFKGPNVTEPKIYLIRMKGKFSPAVTFYLENGQINITGELYKDVTALGTPLNEAYTAYTQTMSPLQNTLGSLYYEMKLGTGTQGWSKAQYKQKIDSVSARIATESRRFIKQNSSNVLGLKIIQEHLTNMSSAQIETAVALLDKKKYVGNTAVSALKQRAASMKKTENGRTAPAFLLADTTGKTLSLASFRGKYVLIDFWASWCVPCRAENPNVKKAYDQFKDKGFEVVGISLDKTTPPWLKAVEKDGLNWTNLIDPTGIVAKDYAILGIPQNFLVNPEGKIIASALKGEDLHEKLKNIFQ